MASTPVHDQIDILLVEPNPGDSRLFTEKFQDAKLMNTIYAVTDGESALDFVRGRGEYATAPRPDVILLDPQLPGKSGEEVLQELRGDPALADIPIVVLTSSAAEESIVRSHGLEVDTYITKPVEPEEFVSFVQSVEDFWLAIVQRNGDP